MSKNYISEIQGLRTLAALLVAVYHIWFSSVSGGVDIFFVVSAYFIAHTLNKYEELSWKQVSSYYSKTLRRILPTAITVFCFTCLVVLIATPFVSYKMEIKNAFSTFFFVENWYLASSGSDYLRQGESKSLFQQFWALSVQVQLYICIPILYLYAKKLERRLNLKNIVTTVLMAVFACSFTYSTSWHPEWAYFDTLARVWEFTAGLLLYHLSGKLRVSKRSATLLNFLAVVAIISFGLYWGQNYALPGVVALIPVLSACIIIVTSKSLYFSILKWRGLTSLGDYSFAFYLWHWPIYLLLFQYTDTNVNFHLLGLGVIVSSAILAFISTKYIEGPLRRSSTLIKSDKKTYGFSAGGMIAPGFLIVCIFSVFSFYEKPSLKALSSFYKNKDISSISNNALFPHGTVIKQDMRESYFNNCEQNMQNSSVVECEYGNKKSDFTIALVGGSHAAQWLSPLKEIALEQGFKIHLMIKSACSLVSSTDRDYKPTQSCLIWNKNLQKRLIELNPNIIITTVTRNGPKGERIPYGYLESWQHIKDNLPNTNIVGIRDNPWFTFDPPLCLEVNGPKECSISRTTFYNDEKVMPILVKHIDVLLDFSKQFCPDGRCSTVLENGLIKFKDKHHLTKSYALLLKPILKEGMQM
ncbi:acyltransferase family protein [Alteromonas sp. CI.11.F.A3]|uniref:acyltransferase family protein n=1 Tax=Alteromonas sp. CI.11.F.A3 TaxID=3079555 RepID=UPI002941E527|nr:acyltransferase family protein [Alteromonas sp. CI.11.F.A3]WOI36108.1 acyltransferase family protein [Alteromonas sp. CI.11.F.A3]